MSSSDSSCRRVNGNPKQKLPRLPSPPPSPPSWPRQQGQLRPRQGQQQRLLLLHQKEPKDGQVMVCESGSWTYGGQLARALGDQLRILSVI